MHGSHLPEASLLEALRAGDDHALGELLQQASLLVGLEDREARIESSGDGVLAQEAFWQDRKSVV